MEKGGLFFDYFAMAFALISFDEEPNFNLWNPDEPEILDMSDVGESYVKAVGDNTGYNFHPEECLAENFRFLTSGNHETVKDMWVLKKLEAVLTGKEVECE